MHAQHAFPQSRGGEVPLYSPHRCRSALCSLRGPFDAFFLFLFFLLLLQSSQELAEVTAFPDAKLFFLFYSFFFFFFSESCL